MVLLLCRSVSFYLYTKTPIEWELRAPSRTRFFEGRLRRFRYGIFIVQDEDFGPKNGLRQNLSKKKRLPEVENVASGRRLLAVLDVVLYDRAEASRVRGFGEVMGQ